MKTNRFFIKNAALAIMCSLFALTSCSSDDNKTDDEGQGNNPAVIAAVRVNTPSGRVFYLGAYDKFPSTLDYKTMTEIGPGATIYSYGEHPYVWNGTASTLTRYNVSNDMKISASDALSLAGTGVSGTFGPPAFVSETEAYFFALNDGKIIKFNPTSMTITETIAVTPLPLSNDAAVKTSTYSSYVTSAKKIILPVGATPTDYNKFPQYAQIAVFDIASKVVTYVKDTRMSMGYFTFAKGNDGTLYYRSSRETALSLDYSTVTGNPPTGGLLKVNPDGTFDPNFFVDLRAAINAHSVNVVPYVNGDKALAQYLDNTFTPPAKPAEWYNATTKYALVDLKTLKVEPFTSFEQYGTVYSVGTIDGVEYYGNIPTDSNNFKYRLLKQKGAAEFEAISEALGGSLIFVGKLR
ncbi:hypothetical protein PQ462_10140 [Flavobacterium sp. KACC 22758]|jgi:hypothetical protein|uniref:hypothetical protein n=1 Tax=Flavobacterium sp. KACC 22758 TaxID=3025667 RepID=UPI00236579CD|nr:hypothetical protein [Flavobacterium sp. KACC 22758]WDF61729.1 hypothetical protein PQ462_10140 [Flavobacterium sp. KACC 22758]